MFTEAALKWSTIFVGALIFPKQRVDGKGGGGGGVGDVKLQSAVPGFKFLSDNKLSLFWVVQVQQLGRPC